jgi:hypothetical protein
MFCLVAGRETLHIPSDESSCFHVCATKYLDTHGAPICLPFCDIRMSASPQTCEQNHLVDEPDTAGIELVRVNLLQCLVAMGQDAILLML